jgi:hypothetical protein
VPPPSAGSFSEPVRFEFPLHDWSFTATMGPADQSSGGRTDVGSVAPGVWAIELAGAKGPSVVSLSGGGHQGDAHVAFAVELLVADHEPPPTVGRVSRRRTRSPLPAVDTSRSNRRVTERLVSSAGSSAASL